MADINISHVINVGVAAPQKGLSAYNTSNLLLLSSETPAESFGTDGYKIYRGYSDLAADFGTSSKTAELGAVIFSQTPNILSGGGYLVVVPLLEDETLAAAFTRAKGLVNFFGIISDKQFEEADILAAATAVQASDNRNLLGIVASDEAAVAPTTGICDKIRAANLSKTRCLYYGNSDTANSFLAAYFSRALSVDFNGSNTTQTMHLKDLSGVEPDASMTENLLAKCQAAGADVYASIEGVAKVFTSGANDFFDNVYNLQWFTGALQVAYFNTLAKTATKVSQTEAGMSLLKSNMAQVCIQAVTNGYAAPGVWTRPDTFGDPEDLKRNIEDFGWFIYSLPVTQQLQAQREERIAPLTQIALKQAGAFHSGNVMVYINE